MKKILIVEDDQKIALALSVRLKAHGYEVFAAFDALAGLSQSQKHLPDLVILDISMPAGNGFELAARMQSLVPTIGTPIIFITASHRPEFRSKAQELGAAAFIEKPFKDGELIAAVQQALKETPTVAPIPTAMGTPEKDTPTVAPIPTIKATRLLPNPFAPPSVLTALQGKRSGKHVLP